MPSSSKSQSTSAHKTPPALRHGCHSKITVLPGEDQAAYDKLHRKLISEFKPDGELEDDAIATISRDLWRKKNIGTLQFAMRVRHRLATILDEIIAAKFPEEAKTKTHADSEKMVGAAQEQLRAEFGDAADLVESGEAASYAGLAKDLDLEERLDAKIEKSLKRLLFAREIKSMLGVAPPASQRLIAGPSETACNLKEIDHASS